MKSFNERLGVIITKAVGSMWCAYIFTGLALVGLPSAIKQGTLAIVQWVAQTFLQLVLLSVIMVGQDVASKSAEKMIYDTHSMVREVLVELAEEQRELKNSHQEMVKILVRAGRSKTETR